MHNDLECRSSNSEEVDLLEFLEGIWQQKLLIFLVTIAVAAVALAYALLAKPVYEAKVFLAAPSSSDIADLNYGRTSQTGLEPFTSGKVFDIFVEHLNGESLRRRFFKEVYLPSMPTGQGAQGALYTAFNGAFDVVQLTGEPPRAYVAFRGRDPAVAAQWAAAYIDKASAAAKAELLHDVTREAEVRAGALQLELDNLRENGQRQRDDKVTRLQEALRIATTIGLENPPLINGEVSKALPSKMDGELTYMRGSKALAAEIANLQQRKSEDPFISELRDIQTRQQFYQGLVSAKRDINVYKLDGTIEQPDVPVKPKRNLIIALGVIVGFGLGCLIAALRYALKNMQRRRA
ncbi:LPS O-antigen chain length determinant protein WzzB [Pseudomonas inefficax]|uniref:LPS O-antigen chain length determinant protein WzzB n=1 Tax=Pseudomonas inefficax TaxID=2078786 RepID=UPI004046A61E